MAPTIHPARIRAMRRISAVLSVRLHSLVAGAFLAVLPLAGLADQTPAPKAPAVPPFEVAKLGPRTWVGRFGTSNCGWVEIGGGVLVIDTGASKQDAANLQAEIKTSTGGKPVKWVVLTHLHSHANTGLPSFVPAATALYVHASLAANMEAVVTRMAAGGNAPKVVGVKQSAVISDGGQSVEVFASKGPASTGADLWVFASEARAAFVGDLAVTGRCPSMVDASCDPPAWMAELQRIGNKKPSVLVGSLGDTSTAADAELAATRAYLERVFRIAKETRQNGFPEVRLSSKLSTVEKVGEYCSPKADTTNGLAIYRRMGNDGILKSGPDPQPPAGVKP